MSVKIETKERVAVSVYVHACVWKKNKVQKGKDCGKRKENEDIQWKISK